jgi:hypothetical protein
MRLCILQSSRESIARSCFLKKLLSIIPWTPPLILFMHIRKLSRYGDEAYTQWRTVLKISANDRIRMWTIGNGAQNKGASRSPITAIVSFRDGFRQIK